jgi:hypothetical protein
MESSAEEPKNAAEPPSSAKATEAGDNCRNCGAALSGPYCHECGQRALDLRLNWRAVAGEALSAFFNLDGKFPRGLVHLLFFPGKLTRDFLDGRRASQIPPLRGYIVISLLFFLLAPAGDSDMGMTINAGGESSLLSEEERREMEAAGPVEGWIAHGLSNMDDLRRNYVQWLPRSFLFGIFALAFFTSLLFRREGFSYLEHLVLALHFQSFFMLLAIVAGGWGSLFGLIWQPLGRLVIYGAIGWAMVYPVLAFRRLFAVSWRRSVVFSGLTLGAYLCYLMFAVVAAGLIAFSLI